MLYTKYVMADDLKNKTDNYWKEKLTPEQYYTLREEGTEYPFTGKFYNNFEDGMYHCAACNAALFSSDTKYDSGCGWPAFNASLKGAVTFKDDYRFGMHRIEVRCANCDSHLGHVFDDSSTKTGKWFCINSSSLNFDKK